MQGPTERYVLLGDPLSLVCGTGLDSNPQATITWTAPDNTMIRMNMGRYTLDNGPEIVRLNFTDTIMGDNGRWTCVVAVTSDRYFVSGGMLVSQDQANIGSITQDIQLTVIGELHLCPSHAFLTCLEKYMYQQCIILVDFFSCLQLPLVLQASQLLKTLVLPGPVFAGILH